MLAFSGSVGGIALKEMVIPNTNVYPKIASLKLECEPMVPDSRFYSAEQLLLIKKEKVFGVFPPNVITLK